MRDSSVDRLIEPSYASFCCAVLLAIAIMGGAIISNSLPNGRLYNLLFGPTSSATQIETAQNTVRAITTTVLGNPTLNKTLFFGFWLLVGLVVYTFVQGFSYYTGGIFAFWEKIHHFPSRKKVLGEQFVLRILLQVIGLLMLLLFSLFFIKILLPFSILCARISAGLWVSWGSFGYFIAGLITMMLSLHLYTILVRFAFLRSRLYGSALS
ncbi:MAG: hypothetical protein V4702_01255 [Patescibacteria group bacterium]